MYKSLDRENFIINIVTDANIKKIKEIVSKDIIKNNYLNLLRTKNL